MRQSARSLIGLVALVAAAALANTGWGEFKAWRLGGQVAQSARAGDIEMLSSVTCPYCDAARAWFAEHEVPVRECFIERDADCAARFAALRSPGTPLLVVRGEPQVGFSAKRVAEALQ
ncbi:MAG: glutaredoxin family protein [Methylibium sp.]|uniref:glutaredoxin family protein n=1 Tax=Methylibium sp. TaxID=2067992 RepID=UPI0017B1EEFF|nr:glutaredoxin family protein [Methylibium sp.]MBA2723951.1 glutaredoxin family protein [Methylibium sp.]MBA3588633.1 glutaredoxin family protein [Methylibium sp.]MBA3624263.1 glutaredoxin family protein [Methylibium sp.]